MTSLITTVLFLITILYNTVSFARQLNPLQIQINTIMAHTVAHSEPSSSSLFTAELFPLIVDQKSTKNVIFSPASIYTSLALIYLGAEGHTADEIHTLLRLGQEVKRDFASKYGKIFKSTFNKAKVEDDAPQLKMTNRLYVSDEIKINQRFNEMAEENFNCRAENVDFKHSLTVVEKINKWVEQQTENKIINLMKPDAVNEDTSAVLVNAIYFKGKWKRPFSALFTSKNNFHISRSEIVEVDTMYTDDKFEFVELDDINAKAIKLPYKSSEMYMLIILPNNKGDLENVEKRLKGKTLNDITSLMKVESVEVYLPKFKIEFDIDLKEPLKKLGSSTMFERNANLTGIFDSDRPQKISDIRHKAFLNCNEAGSEAAAASFLKVQYMMLDMDKKIFRADGPFAFFISSNTTVFFAGHVARIQ